MSDTKQQPSATATTTITAPTTTLVTAGAVVLDPNKRNVTFQTSTGTFTIELYWREGYYYHPNIPHTLTYPPYPTLSETN
jgi:hypothetical protein